MGQAGGELAPYVVGAKVLALGQAKFQVYCAVCHGAEGKGNPVFESPFQRSGLPRFATPSSHEGAVLAFLCRGVRPN